MVSAMAGSSSTTRMRGRDMGGCYRSGWRGRGKARRGEQRRGVGAADRLLRPALALPRPGGSDAPGDVDLLLLRFPQHLDQRKCALPQRDRPRLHGSVTLLVLEFGVFPGGLQLRLFLFDGVDEFLQRLGDLFGGDDAARRFLPADDFEDATGALLEHE